MQEHIFEPKVIIDTREQEISLGKLSKRPASLDKKAAKHLKLNIKFKVVADRGSSTLTC